MRVKTGQGISRPKASSLGMLLFGMDQHLHMQPSGDYSSTKHCSQWRYSTNPHLNGIYIGLKVVPVCTIWEFPKSQGALNIDPQFEGPYYRDN